MAALAPATVRRTDAITVDPMGEDDKGGQFPDPRPPPPPPPPPLGEAALSSPPPALGEGDAALREEEEASGAVRAMWCSSSLNRSANATSQMVRATRMLPHTRATVLIGVEKRRGVAGAKKKDVFVSLHDPDPTYPTHTKMTYTDMYMSERPAAQTTVCALSPELICRVCRFGRGS